MRYHVLGVGSIGSLIAFHLKRSVKIQRRLLQPGPSSSTSRRELLLSNLSNKRPPQNEGTIVSSLSLPPYVQSNLPDPLQTSVTLQLRRKQFGKQAKQRYANSIVVEQDGVRDIEGGFQTDFSSSPTDVIASVIRRNRERQQGDEGEDDDSADRFLISRSQTGSSPPNSIAEQASSKTPIPDNDGGISLISTLEGTHSQPRASPIDSLIVTTKCDATLSALEGIRHRIHPWSTIVLLQNGMGVLDTLLETFFKDADQRPNFVLASTTHGCWRKGPLDIVHAGAGTLHFGIVPSARAGADMLEANKVPFGQTIAQVQGSVLPTRGRLAAKRQAKGWERFSPDADSLQAEEVVQDPEAPSTKLSIANIPDQPSLRTLRATVAGLLSLPLNVEWEPIREFQLRSLRKLVINACINPITALADCKNGDLFGNPAAMDAMWSVCLEAGMVLEAQVREHLASSSSPSVASTSSLSAEDLILRSTETGEPMLHPSLTPQALFQEVQRVARLTAANWSSMHSDFKNRRGSTEIEYMNGYISALGRGYNIDTTANDLLTNLIKLKTTKVTGSARL